MEQLAVAHGCRGCSPALIPTSFFFLLPLFPLPPPLFPFCCNRRQAKRREDRGARATTMATGEELQPRYWESCKRRFPVLQPWTQKLHPVDKKASTRQRNAGKVTTVLTKSFNPQMKKVQTEIEKILLDDDHDVSLCVLLQLQIKKLQPFVKKASSSGEKSFNWHGGKLQREKLQQA